MPDTRQVALVGYVTGPLAWFLDSLQMQLTPAARPHAHLTVLPPRPLAAPLDQLVQRIVEQECAKHPAIEVELGNIALFPGSNVIYLNLSHGAAEIHALYHRLNRGILEHQTGYPYCPHITLAQGLSPAEAGAALPLAHRCWNEYSGSRSFIVDLVSLVREAGPDRWTEISEAPLAPAEHLMAAAARSDRHTSTR